MAPSSSKPLKIAGYTVKRISVGSHTLGQIVINEKVTVVFQIKEDDSGNGGVLGINTKCLTCRISKIRQCSDLVCPDIKENDPNASCADAIKECIKLACQGSCKSQTAGDNGILILA
jgi:hypothetical protein